MADEFERMTTVNIAERSNSEPEWLLPILTQSAQQETLESQRKLRIHKVPPILRDVNTHTESFDPMVVSFGPYHHGNPKLAMVEKLKTTIAKQFIFGREDLQEFCKFEEVARGAREYYDEESTARFSDEEFMRMMFLDGCLLLYSIDRIAKDKLSEDTKIKNSQMAFISRDILLLENQLPFVVLQALMSLNIPGDEGEGLVHEFIGKQTRSISYHSSENQDQDQPPHILHLLRKELVGTEPQQEPIQELSNWHSFRSVTELRAGGIECRESPSSSLKDVSFKIQRFQGNLFLPSIVVDDITRSLLLNLVAYEACPDFANDYAVTSYICFMDALIDHSEDVKELRTKGILLNLLGSDEKVADLFNDLATNLVPNPNQYLEVKDSIEKYYKKKRVIWMTEMLETHFRSPWTAVGFFVAMVIILLTFVQSYFSIFPRGNGGSKKSPSRSPGRKISWND
ncbi:hypothetical protein NE237_009299 [Protea cynaroides]|uniref:Uncharacterized protein n=1 Tax=Protea cynaroides TaxID=273540 RepID=A0A9Q0KY98_9MAGN|nr:hypothetical protein NE237_009299 [Protea cynaroides]